MSSLRSPHPQCSCCAKSLTKANSKPKNAIGVEYQRLPNESRICASCHLKLQRGKLEMVSTEAASSIPSSSPICPLNRQKPKSWKKLVNEIKGQCLHNNILFENCGSSVCLTRSTITGLRLIFYQDLSWMVIAHDGNVEHITHLIEHPDLHQVMQNFISLHVCQGANVKIHRLQTVC